MIAQPPGRSPGLVVISGGGSLKGRLRTPGDKSISHRALLLGALAEGTSVLRGLSDGDDVERTVRAIRAMGAGVRRDDQDTVVVEGGRSRLQAPGAEIDCGNSGTGMRLLAGVAASLPGRTLLVGDQSLSARPMDRVAEPLRAMGAMVQGLGDRCLPPLSVTGGPLRGIEWTPPVASAQVKSAVLLAGLVATGETVVHEPLCTRAHTEEMLAEAGADITVESLGAGRVVRLRPSTLAPLDLTVPGDPSQAAFWVVAGCVVPGSTVVVEDVYVGPERVGFIGVLQRMGARVELRPAHKGTADLAARSGPLVATVIEAAEIPSLDEVPALAIAAAAATGTTRFKDVGELRVKEVDRLAATVTLVRAFGAQARAVGDDLLVDGVGGQLSAGRFHSAGDHRMGMAAAVAALAVAEGESEVTGFDAVNTSYPGFLSDLAALSGQRPGPGDQGRTGGSGLLVAIDGPAGSGKSTVSREVARRLGVERLDTGAMYRAIAWAALEGGIDPGRSELVAEIARDAVLELVGTQVFIDGREVSEQIRSPEVSVAVSVVAANPEVRRHLVARQRRWAAEHGGGVVEGRDIGSVVFPAADLKVYLTASAEERLRRRADESPEGVARRDRLDSTRRASPLAVAEGARVLDTTGRTVEDVVEEVLSWL